MKRITRDRRLTPEEAAKYKTIREQVDHIRSWAYDRSVRSSPRDTGRSH